MLSRPYLGRNYGVKTPQMVITDGAARQGVAAGVPQDWAIARPGNSPSPVGAPQYIYQYPNANPTQHDRTAMRGGSMPLQLRAAPHTGGSGG